MEKIVKDPAEQYYISIPGQSWATFTINKKGDLFINSDWGYFCYAWRAFGDDFKRFSIGTSADYLFGCLERNMIQFYGLKQKMRPRQKEAIAELFKQLQNELKDEKRPLQL